MYNLQLKNIVFYSCKDNKQGGNAAFAIMQKGKGNSKLRV